MDLNIILPSLFSFLGMVLVAYIGIIPAIKKNKVDVNAEDIKKALKTIDTLKRGNTALLRESLEKKYFEYEAKSFKMNAFEIEYWNEEFSAYSDGGGNGQIAEYNDEIQKAIRRNMITG